MNGIRRVTGVRLWPHQDEAATATVKLLDEHDRAHLVSACGTGKTLICAEVARRSKADRRLITVPTLELAGQLLGEWRQHMGGGALGVITGVCSSEEVVRFQGDLDAEVTTSPDVLAARAAAPRCTVISTYASLPVVSAAHARGMPAFDLAVADEAHRTTGPLAGPWTAIHDGSEIRAGKRIYATATPRIGGGEAVVSMDDETVFGPRSFTLSFGEAIRRRLLAEYRFAASVVTNSRIRELILTGPMHGDRLLVGDWLIPIETVAAQIALLRAAARWDLRSVITFHARRGDARLFAVSLPDVARLLPAAERPQRPVHATFVHGGQTPRERARRIERLRAPGEALSVVANVRVLGEGVDVPAVDGVLFANPTRSVVLAAQAVGRALRLGGRPDKTATIIVPVHLTAPETGIDLADEGWEALGQVAAALAAHDERLAAQLIEGRRRLGAQQLDPSGDGQRDHPARVPGWFEITGDPPPPGFSEAVRIHAIRAATGSWEEYYGAARAFYATHGHLLVPKNLVVGDLKLGIWINSQRSRQMHDWQRQLLDEIGMVWHTHDAAWEEWFHLAAQFKRERGHLRLPQSHTVDGKRVGAWFHRQQRAYARGQLRDDRAKRLIELGMEPGWSERENQAQWSQHLDQLRTWLEANPDCRSVPRNLTIAGFSMGNWWRRQLARFEADTLESERVIAIRDLMRAHGLRIRKRADWDHAYELLNAWLKQNNATIVPVDLVLDDINIYLWLRYQIEQLGNGALRPERETKLRALIPGTDPHDLFPSSRQLTWDQTYQLLETWIRDNGTEVVPRNLRIKGKNIYGWLRRQLEAIDHGELPAEQTELLSRLRSDGNARRLMPRRRHSQPHAPPRPAAQAGPEVPAAALRGGDATTPTPAPIE